MTDQAQPIHGDSATPTLLPCPHCGGAARLEYTPLPDFSGKGNTEELSWHVECASDPSVRCPGKHWLCSSAQQAIAGWNQRDSAALARRVQEYDRLLAKCHGYLMAEILRRTLNESAHNGVQALSNEISKHLDATPRPDRPQI